MPRIKRWMPINQDINGDHELWHLTDTFGDRAMRLWLEVLSILERTENQWRLTPGWLAALSRRCRQSSAKCSRIIRHCMAVGWLIGRGESTDGWPSILSSPKYAEYHKTRGINKPTPGKQTGSLPSESSESSESLKENIYKRKKAISFPETFSVSDQIRKWALANSCPDPNSEFEGFRDHHVSKGNIFKDWEAAFRTWLRNAKKFQKGTSDGKQSNTSPTRAVAPPGKYGGIG